MQVSQTMLQSNPWTITNVLGENSSKEMKFVIVAFMHSQWSHYNIPFLLFCDYLISMLMCVSVRHSHTFKDKHASSLLFTQGQKMEQF